MINKLTPKFNLGKIISMLFVALILLCLCLGLFSCNSEKKALRPFNKVLEDPLKDYAAPKKELLAKTCAVHFPINEKIIIKDSIVEREKRVQDFTQINKLKRLLAKGCPTIDIDSILFNNMLTDTIYIDHYKTKVSVVKDTTGNYFRQQSEDNIRNANNELIANAAMDKVKINDAAEKNKVLKTISDKWRLRFFILLGLIIAFIGVKIFLKYRI